MINKKMEITKDLVLDQVEFKILSKKDLIDILKYQSERPEIKKYIDSLENIFTESEFLKCCQEIKKDSQITQLEIPYYINSFPNVIPMDLIRNPDNLIFYPEETILI